MLMYTGNLSNKGIIGIIERTCNHIDPRLLHHGLRVSYLVSKLLPYLGVEEEKEQRDICLTALLHDIGAYKTEEIDRMIQFETSDVAAHTSYGYLFVRNFSPLSDLAEIVLLHHTPYESLKGKNQYRPHIKKLSQLLSVADRVDMMSKHGNLSWEEMVKFLEGGSGTMFDPEIVELAKKLEGFLGFDPEHQKEDVYFDILYRKPFTSEEITGYLNMIIYVIDFRSRYTVTHTITTTSIAQELGILMGLDDEHISQIVCGSMLHDLGKIGIPVEILEFPGKLSPQATVVMREHVNIGERIFCGDIDESVQRIALRHHEKLNGSGYPRGLQGKELTLSERIVAVADIISALAGTRSYKEAFDKERIISIIEKMSQDGYVDQEVVKALVSHFDQIMSVTYERCQPLLNTYQEMNTEYEELLSLLNHFDDMLNN